MTSYPWFAWLVLSLTCAAISVIWIILWWDQRPIVGWVVGIAVALVPAVMAIVARVTR